EAKSVHNDVPAFTRVRVTDGSLRATTYEVPTGTDGEVTAQAASEEIDDVEISRASDEAPEPDDDADADGAGAGADSAGAGVGAETDRSGTEPRKAPMRLTPPRTPTDARERRWTPRPRAASRGQARSQTQLPLRRTATTCRARELSSHFRSVSARERSSSVLC